jgi:hypothetical protein
MLGGAPCVYHRVGLRMCSFHNRCIFYVRIVVGYLTNQVHVFAPDTLDFDASRDFA